MPRYLVERTFPDHLTLPGPYQSLEACLEFIENNHSDGVTWVHSYISSDGKKSFCVYDAPSPEAIRNAAQRNNLPIDRISEVRVLNPYYYK
jgi:hypothetical protein